MFLVPWLVGCCLPLRNPVSLTIASPILPCGSPGSTTLTGYRFHNPPTENPVWVFGKGFFNSRLPRYCTHPSTLQAGLLAKVLLNKPGFSVL
jgi:hypothetical protein